MAGSIRYAAGALLVLCAAAYGARAYAETLPEPKSARRAHGYQEPAPDRLERFRELSVAHAFRVRRGTDPRQGALAAFLLNTRARESPEYVENDDYVRRAAASDDVFVAWLFAFGCPGSPAVCDERARAQRFADLEPDNALPWMLLARLAHARGDAPGARAMLERAARSRYYEPHVRDMLVEARRFYGGIAYTEADADTYSIGRGIEVTRHHDAAGLASFARHGFDQSAGPICHATPSLPEDAVRADCIAAYRLVAQSDKAAYGTYVLLTLTRGLPEHFEIGERYLDSKWLDEQRIVIRLESGEEATAAAWYDEVVAHGEDGALRRLLQRRGRPASRPATWVPQRLSDHELELLAPPTTVALPRPVE